MKINEYMLWKNSRYCDESFYYPRGWYSIDWYNNRYISLDEMIVVSELHMMYGSRYDEVILNDYDKAIKGYKNWNDFRRRTQLFYLGKEHNIDKESVLYNLIIKEFEYLFDYNRSVIGEYNYDYLEYSSRLVLLLRLYHLKRYDKYKIINWMNDLKSDLSYEPQRMAMILSIMKIWSYEALSKIVRSDLSERLYCLSMGRNPWNFMKANVDFVLIPENDEDRRLIEKFNKIY